MVPNLSFGVPDVVAVEISGDYYRIDERDLGKERDQLSGLIDKFAAGGAAGCTRNPHSFFGKMTPEEWAILMYKHLDHHLRQFGV